jgi:hypothetical protein
VFRGLRKSASRNAVAPPSRVVDAPLRETGWRGSTSRRARMRLVHAGFYSDDWGNAWTYRFAHSPRYFTNVSYYQGSSGAARSWPFLYQFRMRSLVRISIVNWHWRSRSASSPRSVSTSSCGHLRWPRCMLAPWPPSLWSDSHPIVVDREPEQCRRLLVPRWADPCPPRRRPTRPEVFGEAAP